MSTRFVVFDLASGRIKRTGVAMDAGGGASAAASQAEAGEGVLVGVTANPMTQYVDTSSNSVVARPSLILSIDKTTIVADGVDTATITGIPANATFAIPSRKLSGVISDGVLEVTSNVAGAFDVIVELFPFRVWKATIVAT